MRPNAGAAPQLHKDRCVKLQSAGSNRRPRMDHSDIKSTTVYLKGIRSKDATHKVNSGELAGLVA